MWSRRSYHEASTGSRSYHGGGGLTEYRGSLEDLEAGQRAPQASTGPLVMIHRGCWVSRRALLPPRESPRTSTFPRACTARIPSLSTGTRSPIMRPSGTARTQISGPSTSIRIARTAAPVRLETPDCCCVCDTREKGNHIFSRFPFPVSRFVNISRQHFLYQTLLTFVVDE
jgi:hypothetical protein